MESKLPIYEFLIDEDGDYGVKTISLVTHPALKSSFIAFDEDKKKPKYVFIESDEKKYKGIVAGLALIPDKMVYRVDEEGNEYMGYFSKETIEKIRDKYHKEVLNLNSVNLEHSELFVDAYLVESYLLNTPARIAEVKEKGIVDAVDGAWFTAFKVENKEVFTACVNGVFTGFSVEAFLDRELRLSQNKFNNQKIKKMKKNLIERLKERVNKILDEVRFEEALVPELNVTITWDSEGSEVTKTYNNEAGDEVIEPIGAGEFILEDGRTVVVDDGSMLVEVRDAVAEEEPVVEDVPVEEPVVEEPVVEEPVVEEVPPVSGDTEVVAEVIEDVPLPVGEDVPVVEDGDVSAKTLGELIDVTTDGDYVISVKVAGGMITEAAVSAEQMLVTQQLNDKIAELEAKLSDPITDPLLTDKKLNKDDITELTVFQRVARRKGLDY